MNKIEIQLPEPCGETGKFAGEELKSFLSQCRLSADVTVAFELDPALGDEEFLLSGRGSYVVRGGSETALLYGAYELLKQFGFRFFGPDPWDTVIPEGELVPPETHVRFQPAFELRGFFAVEKRDTAEFLLWMARNYLNFWTHETNYPELCRKLGMKLRGNPPSGMHRLFEDFLPPSVYAEKHPEYYALHQGKRIFQMDAHGWNICTSSRGAAEQLAENLCAALNPGGVLEKVSAVGFAPFDNGSWCECENCAAQGNPTTRMLLLADLCSKAIRKKVKRPVQLIVPAYHETLPPPDMPLGEDFDYERIAIEFFPIERCYAHTIDDPSCPANALLKKCYDAWAGLKKFRLSIGEYYNVSTFGSAALVFDDTMAHDLAFYRRTGSRYINYMHVSTALWGELTLNNGVFAAETGGRPFDLTDFLEKRYGPAAAPVMREFYARLRRFSHLAKPLFHYFGTGETKPGISHFRMARFCLAASLKDPAGELPFFLPGHFEENVSSASVPSLNEALKLLGEAEKLLKQADPAGNERVRKCLETDRMRFEYTVRRVRFTVAMIHLLQAEKAGKNGEALRLAGELREYGEAMRKDRLSVAHIREKGAPNLKLYVNALTVTELQRLYMAKMEQYHQNIEPLSAEEGSIVHQG